MGIRISIKKMGCCMSRREKTIYIPHDDNKYDTEYQISDNICCTRSHSNTYKGYYHRIS